MCCGNLLIVYLTLPFTGKDLNFNSDCPSGNLKILCTKLRRGASKTPTVKCCVRQPTCGDREQADVPSKRFKRKTRSPRGSHTEIPIVSSSWHQRCTMCQKRNPLCCVSIPTDAELSEETRQHTDASRDHSEVTRELSDVTREQSDNARCIHLDGSNCACSCCTCCWAIEDSAYELLERCLDLNPHTRITAAEALEHAFFKNAL